MGVTVVIPCYQQSNTLRAAVESAFSEAAEVIVVNDASTDGFASALHGLLVEHEHLRVLHTYARAGVCYARNFGIRHARHSLIFPLDADDTLIPGRLAALERAWQPGTAVYGDWIEHDTANGRIETMHAPPPQMLYRKPPARGFLFALSDWERAGQYDPAFNVGAEDWAFMLALQRVGVQMAYTEVAVINYHLSSSGRSATCRERWPLIETLITQTYGQTTERYSLAR